MSEIIRPDYEQMVGKNQNPEREFKSDLGNYNFGQDTMLKFGKRKEMKILTALLLLQLFLSLIILVPTLFEDISMPTLFGSRDYNWIKIFIVGSMFMSTLLPLGISYITWGASKRNINRMNNGIRMIRLLITISYIVLIISAVLFGMTFLQALFRMFIHIIILCAIIGGLFYVLFKYLHEATAFTNDLLICMKTFVSKRMPIFPKPLNLRPYLIFYLVIFALVVVVSWFGSNAIPTELTNPMQSTLGIIGDINLYLRLFIMGYSLYVLNEFHYFLQARKKEFQSLPEVIGNETN